ncbi:MULTISPECIES: glycosyltransferase [unclassified Rhizobium]|jgi:glycosyltransferase involved in cell wall biosynthesis|uniref:glycosyltransferase n=1 Tax=unclassified Rhizobium TaxID=2613769 RepID=UPI000646BDF4|nr:MULTISPECIES: glycosyltransferase [unclassified Rhizobium]MBN8952377.1 glycosyltransferase [Rhizobium tropici]OJY78872.1 MAG: glycosyl transferase [Rhizobium sp. 60-20]RKD35645.1 glycosyltransferase involved in cell wall biosynthesis [Rhizobium sp. WW_1]
MRVAIVHYWLVSMRGGEKVIEALCDMYPDADIFTLVCDESRLSEKIRKHRIFTSFLQRIPGAVRAYQSLLPLMPFALESFDLTGYDLIISSESGPAKGIIPPPRATHVCYCHSPMRYLWDHYHFYRSHAGLASRLMLPMLAPLLRSWDVNTSMRVDRFVANSHHVSDRIGKYYRRPATVVYPPVNVDDFAPAASTEDFYLCAGQLVPYKRVDLAVQAFTRMNRQLVVIGEGTELERLKRIAGPSVTFLGRTPFSVLKEKLARCRALVFPGEEDFGMVPVEAMASGRPVIAYGSGGALETVMPGVTGVLFDEQSADALVEAVLDFEATQQQFRPETLQAHAQQFSLRKFTTEMQAIINEELLARTVDRLRSHAPVQRTREAPLPVLAMEPHNTTLQ